MSRSLGLVVACVLGIGAALAVEPDAEAGYRELGFVFTPMHTGDDAAARRCYTRLRKAIAGEEGSDVVHSRVSRESLATKLDEATMASWTHAPDDAFEVMQTWEPRVWRGWDGKTIGGGYTVDAFVMIDCQPDARRLDVVSVAPATGSVMRLRLADRAIDAGTRGLAKELIMSHAWADFSP